MKIALIGASVRPLIESCLKTEHIPIAFDFFNDLDSQDLIRQRSAHGAKNFKIKRYEDLLNFDLSALADAAVLSGGAELRPDVVNKVAAETELLGTGATELSRLHSPINWLNHLDSDGFSVPTSQFKFPSKSRSDWLAKPSSSCGGSQIQFASEQSVSFKNDFYFQKFIPGRSASALFVSYQQNGNSRSCLLGISEQIVGDTLTAFTQHLPADTQDIFKCDKPFAYVGSIFPCQESSTVDAKIFSIGSSLASEFNLQGVWGLDFVIDENSTIWPVDLNPRITASAELYESFCWQQLKTSILDLHVRACLGERLYLPDLLSPSPKFAQGKLVLYNQTCHPVSISQATSDWLLDRATCSANSDDAQISFSDIPAPHESIDIGSPLTTLKWTGRAEQLPIISMTNQLYEQLKRQAN